MKVEPIFFSTLPNKLSTIWNCLLEQSLPPKFQYEFPYMEAWSQYLREDWKHFLLLVKENNNVKGIFPLMYKNNLNRSSFYTETKSKQFITKIIEHNQKTFRSYWLKFDNNYIAYIFGFEVENVFYYWNVAFNPDYSRFYPSRLLLFYALQDCHNRKLKEFNFMQGEADYKLKWTKQFRNNYKFTIKNNNHFYGKIISSLENIL